MCYTALDGGILSTRQSFAANVLFLRWAFIFGINPELPHKTVRHRISPLAAAGGSFSTLCQSLHIAFLLAPPAVKSGILRA